MMNCEIIDLQDLPAVHPATLWFWCEMECACLVSTGLRRQGMHFTVLPVHGRAVPPLDELRRSARKHSGRLQVAQSA